MNTLPSSQLRNSHLKHVHFNNECQLCATLHRKRTPLAISSPESGALGRLTRIAPYVTTSC
jgi:hypothetical protein